MRAGAQRGRVWGLPENGTDVRVCPYQPYERSFSRTPLFLQLRTIKWNSRHIGLGHTRTSTSEGAAPTAPVRSSRTERRRLGRGAGPVWMRRLLRAVGRGLAGGAAALGPAVTPWPVGGADWPNCPYGWGIEPRLTELPKRRCDSCRCLPGIGHPEQLLSCPPDDVERVLWAQFEFERPRTRRP